jgi:hypothetical protein
MSPQKDIKRRMSDKHELYLQQLFGGDISPGSGNQANRPADVRMNRQQLRFSFAFDGKSTLAASQSIPLEMLDKIEYQAHHDRPSIALRYYLDERLVKTVDWCLIKADDLKELLDVANGITK